MNLQEILSIIGGVVVPLGVFMGWIYSRIDKKFDAIDKKFDTINTDLKSLGEKIQSLDSRLSRIEGQLIGPPHWEPKIRERQDNT